MSDTSDDSDYQSDSVSENDLVEGNGSDNNKDGTAILNVTTNSPQEIAEHKRLFNEVVTEHLSSDHVRITIPTKIEMDYLVDVMINPNNHKGKKTAKQYRMIRDYTAINFGNGSYKIVHKTKAKEATRTDSTIDFSMLPRLVYLEELFDCIREVHVEKGGHPASRSTHEKVCEMYSNISRAIVEYFVNLCTCRLDRKLPGRPDDIKPIISKTFNSRGQVDLIDMQSYPDGKFKWIMHYQDHHDKVSYLRPLTRKKSKLVALELFHLFAYQGAPDILQSDNGKEFVGKIVLELTTLLPTVKIVPGRARHPRSQDSVERSNQDIEKMLTLWMEDNKSTHWATIGVHVVQYQKNNRYHKGVNAIPYVLRFGQKCRNGLSDVLPKELRDKSSSEEDVDKLIRSTTLIKSASSSQSNVRNIRKRLLETT